MDSLIFALAGLGTLVALAGLVGLWLALQRRRGSQDRPFAGLRERDFNARVGEAFQLQGFQLVDAARSGPDAQADLVLRRDRQTFVVSTRQRRTAKVGVDALEALHRTMTVHGAAGGFALTAGRFSREATVFATRCNIRLIEAPALTALLARTGATPRPAASPDTDPVR